MLKTTWIKIRTTKDEREKWHEISKEIDLSLSDMIRQAINHTYMRKTFDQEMKKKQLFELTRIRINLNEIARLCSNDKTPIESIEIIRHLLMIEDQLKHNDTY